jgi:hypothetical protein
MLYTTIGESILPETAFPTEIDVDTPIQSAEADVDTPIHLAEADLDTPI